MFKILNILLSYWFPYLVNNKKKNASYTIIKNI